MGRLIVRSEFFEARNENRRPPHVHLDPSWYFPDAHYETSYNRGEGWRYSDESGFPHLSAIHDKQWKKEMKVELRRFIERRLLGSVLYSKNDLSYSYRSSYVRDGKDHAFDSKVSHLYHEFRFEESDDQMLFHLQYAGLLSEVNERHPDYPDVTEEMINLVLQRPIYSY